jgi:ribosomal protein S18 acetylase RimI-like enzyme
MPRRGEPALRPATPADAEAIADLIEANRPLFSEEECAIAIDMVREALRPQDADPYQLLVAERSGRVVGYACFGTIPLTRGSYDLYWIVVDRESQGSGVGRHLLAACEAAIARQGGRLVVVETSGRPDYAATRGFYEDAMAYEIAGRIKDFYKPGDDKITYVKRLGPSAGER